MIKTLSLTNFKKHENLTLTFSEGLTAIKGSNEAGKSTIYHAILYALFGARALPMTLADTVTYGKPESSLKVTCTFVHEGVEYTVTRSKSGAVLSSTEGTANGQAEVTKYVESLFKVNADSATKLMIASQNGLRGALESKDAVSLIENLSNLGLLDTLIQEIQTKLPSGNTKAIVDSLADFVGLAPPEDNTLAFTQRKEAALQALATAEQAIQAATAAIDAKALSDATAYVRSAELNAQLKDSLGARIAAAKGKAQAVPEKPWQQPIEALQAEAAEAREASARRTAFQAFQIRPAVTGALVLVTSAQVQADLSSVIDARRALDMQKATALAQLITETHCGLCGKDLENVPEVVDKNNKIKDKVAELDEARLALDQQISTIKATLAAAKAIDDVNRQTELLSAKLAEYTTLNTSERVHQLLWVGDVPEPAAEAGIDYTAMIADSKKAWAQYASQLAEVTAAKKQLADLELEYSGIKLDPERLAAAHAVIEVERTKQAYARGLDATLSKAQTSYAVATSEERAALAAYTSGLESFSRLKAEEDRQKVLLADMQKHNALIKKLRDLRPQVAAELWGIVLSAVSQHFSSIRGTPSVVTRDADSFLVDGRPAAGLSGSTLDSLGLAIRVALNRTFIPSVQFLLLDEPAAGMDDEREAAMLGMLASLGYKQVLVVTHSSIADSYAADVVQI